MEPRCISFDMDGTLIHQRFADMVWLEGLPKLYADQYGGSLTHAKQFLIHEYDKVGQEAIEWYDITYWFQKLDLQSDWKTLLYSYQNHVEIFPEVPQVLETLGSHYPLIVISNAAHEFLEMELDVSGLQHYFHRIFSAVTDFGKTKKEAGVYRQVCDMVGIKHTELVHVGDNWQFDYVTPRQLGITAYYLNRDEVCSSRENHTLRHLGELATKI